jgi:hypothetical protein
VVFVTVLDSALQGLGGIAMAGAKDGLFKLTDRAEKLGQVALSFGAPPRAPWKRHTAHPRICHVHRGSLLAPNVGRSSLSHSEYQRLRSGGINC